MHSSCIALSNVIELVCSCHTYYENAENSKPEVRQEKSFYCCNFMSALLYWFINFHLPPWSSVICLMLFANLCFNHCNTGFMVQETEDWQPNSGAVQEQGSVAVLWCHSPSAWLLHASSMSVCEALFSVGAPVLLSLIWMHSLPLYTTLESSHTPHENLLCDIYGVSFISVVATS